MLPVRHDRRLRARVIAGARGERVLDGPGAMGDPLSTGGAADSAGDTQHDCLSLLGRDERGAGGGQRRRRVRGVRGVRGLGGMGGMRGMRGMRGVACVFSCVAWVVENDGVGVMGGGGMW